VRLLFAIILIALALVLVAVVLLVRPAWSATRCTTYEEQTLGRLHTVCSDGTRAVTPTIGHSSGGTRPSRRAPEKPVRGG
jgi:hypothetical protein